MTDHEDEIREQMLKVIMQRRDCDRAEAVTIMHRTADRLDGYTHSEAVQRNPLPAGRDESCGTEA
jgi:hypothetical protein